MSILLSDAINVFFRILYLLIIVRVFMSWVPGAMFSSFGRLIYSLTDPVLGPVRRMMDKSPLGGGMMVDFSPVIALFILDIIQIILRYIVALF